MAVEGDLNDLSLASLLQTICLDRRKAAIFLKHRQEEGLIIIAGGEVIHAAVGDRMGEEAVFKLLGWTEGTFRLSDHVAIPPRTVKMPWNKLLLEGMRRLDERQTEGGGSTQGRAELTPKDVAQDSALQNDLILLLTQFEQMQTRLAGNDAQRNPLQALQILTEMTNQVADFSDRRMSGTSSLNSMMDALTRACDDFPRLRLVQAQNNRLSAQTISKLYSSWSGDPMGRRETFHQVGRGLGCVLKSYFLRLLCLFHAPETADECREVCDIFLADLAHAVDKIAF